MLARMVTTEDFLTACSSGDSHELQDVMTAPVMAIPQKDNSH